MGVVENFFYKLSLTGFVSVMKAAILDARRQPVGI
jgi:hypothetical protein